MNRILPWSVACTLLASCSTDRDSSSVAPIVDPSSTDARTPAADGGDSRPDVQPLPNPDRPVVPKIVFVPSGRDLTPRPGRPHYPDCSATLEDNCLQVDKVPVPNPDPYPVPPPPCRGRPECKKPVPPPLCPSDRPECNVPPPPPLCPSDRPECIVDTGIGSFGAPASLAVDKAAGLEFAVGMDQETVIRELGDTPPAGYRDVNRAECMRVTLETPEALEIVGPNAQIRQLPKGKPGDFWSWSIRPRRSGAYTVHAKVEVFRSENGKCTEIPLDAFTRRVSLDVSAAGPDPTPPPHPTCLKDGREIPCGSWWSWTTLGWIILSILLAGLVIAIVAKARRRSRRGDG